MEGSRSGDLSSCFLFLCWAGLGDSEVSMFMHLDPELLGMELFGEGTGLPWEVGEPVVCRVLEPAVDSLRSVETSDEYESEEVEMARSFRMVFSSLFIPYELSLRLWDEVEVDRDRENRVLLYEGGSSDVWCSLILAAIVLDLNSG